MQPHEDQQEKIFYEQLQNIPELNLRDKCVKTHSAFADRALRTALLRETDQRSDSASPLGVDLTSHF